MPTALINPPLGSVNSVIRSMLPSLGKSERRVAQECLDFADQVALLSVADLAARAGTSPATVIRTCQNLGFKGFQHLRLLLLRDAGAATRPELTFEDSTVGSRGRVPTLFANAARDLTNSLGSLDYGQLDAAARAIAQARRVFIVGNGGSGPAAQMIALRFLTTGRPCEAPYDAVTQQLAARLLTPDDVCLAISDSGMNSVTLKAVEAAHDANTTIVGVTSYSRSRLSELASLALVAGAAFHSWDGPAVTGNLTQIMLLSALQNEVSEVQRASGRAIPTVFGAVLDIVEDEAV